MRVQSVSCMPISYVPGELHIHISPEVRFVVARYLKSRAAEKQVRKLGSAHEINSTRSTIIIIVFCYVNERSHLELYHFACLSKLRENIFVELFEMVVHVPFVILLKRDTHHIRY